MRKLWMGADAVSETKTMNIQHALAARKRIQDIARQEYNLRGEVLSIARKLITNFSLTESEVSTFWTCDQSPIGMCVFKKVDVMGEIIMGECRYCHQPQERK